MGFYVKNSKQARETIQLIRIYEHGIDGGGFGNVARANETLKEYKQALRKYYKRTDRHIVKDYGIDGFIELEQMPDTVTTEEQAEAYFNDNIRIPHIYSCYDCTGRLFTGWYKLVYRRGAWFVYHCINCDC